MSLLLAGGAAVVADIIGPYFPDEAEDWDELEVAPYEFFGNAAVVADGEMSATLVEQPDSFEWEDRDAADANEEFFWAQGPPDIPEFPFVQLADGIDDEDEDYGFADWQQSAIVVVDQPLGYYPDDDVDDSEPKSTGGYGFPVGKEGDADYIGYALPDAEEAEDEDYGFVDWQQAAVVVAEQPFNFLEQLEEADDEDYQHLDWQVPPDIPPLLGYFPDEAEEADDEAYGLELASLQDDYAYGIVYWPDEANEPEDEDYGTWAEWQVPPDVVVIDQPLGTSYFPDDEVDDPDPKSTGGYGFPVGKEADVDYIGHLFPDEANEPEDEDYGHLDWQVPPDVATEQPYNLASFPDAEEAEDEAYGIEFGSLQDDTLYGQTYWPDEADEPEDEDYQHLDWQVPPDFVLAQPLQLQLFPDESEEPEDEDFGTLDWQLPPDDAGRNQVYFPDQADEPEDEDFGTSADFQRPPDDTGQTVVYWPDEANEPEDEDYFFSAAPFPTQADYVLTALPGSLTLTGYPATLTYVSADQWGGWYIPPSNWRKKKHTRHDLEAAERKVQQAISRAVSEAYEHSLADLEARALSEIKADRIRVQIKQKAKFLAYLQTERQRQAELRQFAQNEAKRIAEQIVAAQLDEDRRKQRNKALAALLMWMDS